MTDSDEAPGSGSASSRDAGGSGEDEAHLSEVLERLADRKVVLDRYEVLDEIDSGGMGIIKRVWDTDLRRHMAMKIATAGRLETAEQRADSMDPRTLSRFIEEAQVTGQLDHPGIVPVHEMGLDENGRMYFTMRLVRGRNLEAIFARVHAGDAEWTRTSALNMLLKVCDAMAYAHSKGVLHRDLKPANVMVGRFGEVYVMDWGLARAQGSQRAPSDESSFALDVRGDRSETAGGRSGSLATLDGDVMGTPAYMPPEQAFAKLSDIGPAADIYAVGAVLYHLLSGRPPYAPAEPGADELTPFDTLMRVRAGPPQPIHELAPDAPAELCAICEKAMAREVSERYPSMEALGRDLRSYLEGRVVEAYEAGAVAEFRKWVARNRELALTAIAAALVLVVGLSAAALVLAGKNRDLTQLSAQAERSARLADDRATKVLRLSDIKRLQQLRDEAELLWPAAPERTADLTDWLDRAAALLLHEPDHQAELARLRERALPPPAGAEGAGAEGVSADFTFATAEDQWQHDALAELTDDLVALRHPDGLVQDVERRLAFAESVEERTLTGERARSRWEACLASLSDPAVSPAYAGLELRPQLGLLPLGPDPESGLLEFAHVQTGDEPLRDPRTGALAFGPSSSLVFVLVPGGTALIGAQSEDPDAPAYDPLARDNEGPPREFSLAPYFISKYEMTQHQWSHFTGQNPSVYTVGEDFDQRTVTGANPVEQVSWEDCELILGRLGLRLPTEVQWEFAARGGTGTPWWNGARRDSIRGAANLADQAAARAGATWTHIADWPDYDDGFAVHAPVDALAPNPFGLHHVQGNLLEWCSDHYLPGYAGEFREGDAERLTDPSGLRTLRGGSYYHAALHARTSYRNPTTADKRFQYVGVRPVRALD